MHYVCYNQIAPINCKMVFRIDNGLVKKSQRKPNYVSLPLIVLVRIYSNTYIHTKLGVIWALVNH